MAVIYRHNPMPTKGALFVTNPRKKSPALRINRHKFAKFIAKKKGKPKDWRKWAAKSMLRSPEYRTKIAPKFKKLYMAMAEREKRLSLERVKRASLVSAWKGLKGPKAKTAARTDAVRELMKAPLRMTKAEATTTFNRLYKPAKAQTTKRKSKSRKGNPMAVKLRRNVRVGTGDSARDLKMAQIWHDWQHQQAKKGKTQAQIRKSYYYTHLPKVLKRYVKVGRLTDAEAKSLLKRVRKKYRLAVASPKRVAAKTRTTTAGKARKTARKAYTGTKQEANKKAKAAIKQLVRSKRVLSFAKFRKLYKGCGHSMKTVGRFYRTYKKAVLAGKTGSAPGRRGITPARRKAAKKRTTTKKVSTKSKKKMSSGMQKYQTFRKRLKKQGKTPKQISAAWATAKAKTGVKVSSKKRTAGKKRNEWQIFTKKFGGRGLTRTQMTRLYKKSKAEQNLALSRLKKVKARKGESKYAASKRYKKRTSGMARQRGKRQPQMGPYLLRLNPRKSKEFTLLKPVFWASDLVNKTLSTISPTAGYIAGMGVQVLALTGLNFWASRYTQPLISKIPTIPQQIPMLEFAQPVFNVVGDVLEEVPMTLNGIVVGASMGLLAKYGLVDKKNAQMVAAGSFFAGMVLDSAFYFIYGPVSTAASRSEADEGYKIADEMASEYQGVVCADTVYGDGGAYIIGQNSQALGYGGLGHEQHSQWNPQVGGNMRHQRSIGLLSPTDMSSLEGESALAGRSAFAQLMASAGAQGTRWKDLIDKIGFANFQRLASMDPEARLAALRRLKKLRPLSSQGAHFHQKGPGDPTVLRQVTIPNTGLESAALPISGASNGVGAVTGFGAIMEGGLGY